MYMEHFCKCKYELFVLLKRRKNPIQDMPHEALLISLEASGRGPLINAYWKRLLMAIRSPRAVMTESERQSGVMSGVIVGNPHERVVIRY